MKIPFALRNLRGAVFPADAELEAATEEDLLDGAQDRCAHIWEQLPRHRRCKKCGAFT